MGQGRLGFCILNAAVEMEKSGLWMPEMKVAGMHDGITCYGTMIAWSGELGRDAIAKLLTTTFNEERAADEKLAGLGEKTVNLKAAS